MRKIILQFTGVLGLMIIALNFGHIFTAFAALLPITDKAKEVFQGGNIPVPSPGKEGQQALQDLVLGALSYAKVILGVVGIFLITIIGLKLIFAGGNEEDVTKSKQGLIYAIVAFVLVSMSQDLAKVFDMSGGGILKNPQVILERVRLFDKQTEIVTVFIKYVIAAIATIMIIASGIKIISAGGNEEEVKKSQKNILIHLGGLILIFVGDIFINKVFYKVDKNVYSGITGVHPGVDAKAGVAQIAGITNFIMGFIGPIALLVLLAGGIMYAVAGGEEEKMNKAKRLIFATIIAIIIIYGAFAIVNTIIGSKLTQLGAMIQ